MISVEVGEAVNDPNSESDGDGPSFNKGTDESGNGGGTAGGLPLGIVAGAAGGGVALIAFIVIVALVIRKKNSRSGITAGSPRTQSRTQMNRKLERTWSHTQIGGDGSQTGTELPERVGKQLSETDASRQTSATFDKCELDAGMAGLHANPMNPAAVEMANPMSTPTGGKGPALSPIMPQAMPVRRTGSLDAAWVECHDPTTGKKYYANKTTGETQWTQPV